MDTKVKNRYRRIAKECFWEYDFAEEEIMGLFESRDIKKKLFLFEKILLNSQELFMDVSLFAPDDLRELVERYEIPAFNSEYISRRKNSLEYYFFDTPLQIDELKWTA